MSWRGVVARIVGAGLVALLLVLLPEDVFSPARSLVVVFAAAVLLWVAAAVFFVPARRALSAAFVLGLREEQGWFAMPPEAEMRATFRPLVVPFVLLAIAAAATLLR